MSRLPLVGRLSEIQSDPPFKPSSPLQGSRVSPVSLLDSKPTLSATASPSPSTARQTAHPVPERIVAPEALPIAPPTLPVGPPIPPPTGPSIPPPVVPSTSIPTPLDRSRSVSEKTAEPSGSTFNNVQAKSPVPEKFRHLVDVLETFRKGGNDTPLRTQVAVNLVEASPKVYAQAGVTRFKEYSWAAERAGIVTLGGYLGDTWISLRPEFCDRRAGAPSVPSS